MDERYHCAGRDDCPYPWLEELLCEYVDGNMDPAVANAFEEYLHANPDLAAYVEQLRSARSLLCRYGCRIQAPQGFRARVHQRVAREFLEAHAASSTPKATTRLSTVVEVTSAMAVMLMLGMLVGTSLFVTEPQPISSPPSTSSATQQEQRSVLSPLSLESSSLYFSSFSHRPVPLPLAYPHPSTSASPTTTDTLNESYSTKVRPTTP